MAGFKPILINNPSYLCIQYNNLQVQNTATNTKVAIPLTDIATVVLNHNAISLSASVLSAFAEHNIALLTLNSKYMPISITTPLNTYYKASAVGHAQLQVSNSLLGNLWQHIIKNKITNQATCLNKLNLQGNTILKLASTVKLADKDNTEAIAARLYFIQLFNKNFNREENTLNNAMLNFGYAIVRSNIAKFIVGYGLNPMLGVKHCSMLNNFNLADDLIEPFRALIDYNVKQYIINNNITNDSISLTTEHKKYLLNLLFFNINTPLGNTTLLNAIEQYVLSFVKSILQQQNLLININFITD